MNTSRAPLRYRRRPDEPEADGIIITPTETWEGTFTERMVVHLDDDGTLRGWYTANDPAVVAVGYAMSHKEYHYPMQGRWTSLMMESPATGSKVVAFTNTGSSDTSVVFEYRSAASIIETYAASWTARTSGQSATLSTYYQIRVTLRTMHPLYAPTFGGLTIGGTAIGHATFSKGLESSYASVGGDTLTLTKSIPPYAWTKYWSNPVMEKAGSTWRQGGVSAGAVLKAADGTWQMWPSGEAGGIYQVGYATSPDGVTWTYGNGDAALANINDAVAGGADPCVILDDEGVYHMWLASTGTRYSTSDDGVTWAAVTHVTADAAGSPVAISVVKIGDIYHYWWEDVDKPPYLLCIMHGTTTELGAKIADGTLCMIPMDAGAPWGQLAIGTPWMILDGERVIGYIKADKSALYQTVQVFDVPYDGGAKI